MGVIYARTFPNLAMFGFGANGGAFCCVLLRVDERAAGLLRREVAAVSVKSAVVVAVFGLRSEGATDGRGIDDCEGVFFREKRLKHINECHKCF